MEFEEVGSDTSKVVMESVINVGLREYCDSSMNSKSDTAV